LTLQDILPISVQDQEREVSHDDAISYD